MTTEQYLLARALKNEYARLFMRGEIDESDPRYWVMLYLELTDVEFKVASSIANALVSRAEKPVRIIDLLRNVAMGNRRPTEEQILNKLEESLGG